MINVTSLIDVMFLLVLFFMLSSTFNTQAAINLVLPRSTTAEQRRRIDDRSSTWRWTARSSWTTSRREGDDLRAALRQMQAGTGEDRIMLTADEGARARQGRRVDRSHQGMRIHPHQPHGTQTVAAMRKGNTIVERIPFKSPLAALLLALALGAGCTSDSPNGVGQGLADIALDSVLVPLTLWTPTSYGALDVTNEDLPLDETEVLYLGRDDDDASSILVTFDFSDLPNDLWTEEFLQAGNIVSVRLQLQMLTWYFPNHDAGIPDLPLPSRYWPGAQKYYDVHVLDAPLDTLSYPGPEPSYSPFFVNASSELEGASGPIFIDLSVEVVAEWLAGGEPVSLIVREGGGSEPGLLGFSSKEMTHGGSTLPPLRPDASLGPTLIIDTTEFPEVLPDSLSNLVVRPVADVSTWHEVEAAPADVADGLLFRTHLRSYPALGFDLSRLPPNVRVNRAELTLVTDTTRTTGPSHVMVASEVRDRFRAAGGDLGGSGRPRVRSLRRRWALRSQSGGRRERRDRHRRRVVRAALSQRRLRGDARLPAHRGREFHGRLAHQPAARFLVPASRLLRHRRPRHDPPAAAEDRLQPAERARRGAALRRFAVLALLLAATTARAQNPFVLVGPGEDISSGSARVSGRGGWGMAESDTLSPSFLNPAALGDLRKFAVMFGGFGETSVAEGVLLERRSYRTFLPEVRLAIPLDRGQLSLHSGFSVRRSAQYRTEVSVAWDWEGTQIRGYERVIRDGTLFHVPLGLGWRAASWLALGAGVDWVWGPMREELAHVAIDTLGAVLPNALIEEDIFGGVTATFSALLEPPGPFSLGFNYTLAHDSDVEHKVSLGGVSGRLESDGTARMPDEARAGLQVDLGPSWRVGADAKLARWSTFEGIAEWEAILRDEWTFAVGIERRLSFQPLNRGYVTPIRAGYSWRRWASEVGGAPVDEQTWSVGTGFPLSNRMGTVDLGLSYFLLGDQDANGLTTQGWRLALSVTGLEGLIF